MSSKTIRHYVLKCLNTEEKTSQGQKIVHPQWNLKSWKQYVYQKNIN